MKKQGEILQEACRQAGMTAPAIAKRLGLTREYTYALFKKQYISSEIISAVAEFLPVQPADFFEPSSPSDYTVILFRGAVKTEGLPGELREQVMQVFHFPAGR